MKTLINADALVLVGKPSVLFNETNPDWAPSLLFGYSFKHAGAARHERAENSVTKSGKRRPSGAEHRPMCAYVDEAECGSLSMTIF
ncbi:hypothetical protein HPB52_025076 [Rhipicephalus sanguineus]|uniref:Uncharacterized protein n=1 Tax=Rhipicephalus sanguineus TaxID=34632 RepID=A0A9D4TDG9_RHISA|nr:hypothetical protein HPB52_025076 [Rhipicephalus sanguineus]